MRPEVIPMGAYLFSLTLLLELHVKLPDLATSHEQLVLRWLHLIFGIIWIGLLYFLNLVNIPLMKELDGPTKGKVFPGLMSRVMWWFRWSAVITWLAGFRYFMILTKTDASNAGDASLMWKWLGIWMAVWVVAFVVLYGLLVATPVAFKDKGAVLGVCVILVVTGTSWLVLNLLAQPGASNRTLSIAVGGGLGTIMLLNVWGIVWRCQKRLIQWVRESAERGTPLPPQAASYQRLVFLTARTNFWLSFPMLFFMATSAHYEFLMGM
jgi:uncharacterized membrane protein